MVDFQIKHQWNETGYIKARSGRTSDGQPAWDDEATAVERCKIERSEREDGSPGRLLRWEYVVLTEGESNTLFKRGNLFFRPEDSNADNARGFEIKDVDRILDEYGAFSHMELYL